MFSDQQLSSEEVDLVLQLIQFARSNDFFQSEFDDEDTCAHYVHLQEVAGGLDQRLTQVQESVDELEVKTVRPSRGDAEATEIVLLNGKTCLTASQPGSGSKGWWDLSNIKLGLPETTFTGRLAKFWTNLVNCLHVVAALTTDRDCRKQSFF